MKKNVVLLGAGGKMGCRLTANLKDESDLNISYVEISEQGRRRLKDTYGVEAVGDYGPLENADTVVFAVPDILIQNVSRSVIPLLKSGATVIGLDPAAHYGKVMQMREDLKYFVVHPCHPPLFAFEDNLSLAAQKDWFGGVGAARMDLACSIHQGSDEDYEENEDFARRMFRPVNRCFRLTIDQMIMLEPALVESITAPLVKGMRMAVDACVEQGVPRDAVMAFVMGHLKVQFGVLFDFAGFPFSDGANLALRNAMDVIFKPDWIENIMSRKAVDQSVYEITHELNKEK
ncbi:phosphogluconate dehydrogenase C-terminal domain-containing protein [Clostridium sp. AM58-1XD]|uniref:phosphogluconate dehydrogenase C-terminal domain-containing protein n=1 Tax=Clostridium sp. AM58-1XD TaxID=2292307 RepID=UPI0015F4A930|nr:phosphogluconate dehydrogenase C-terminal domain-containing protein [Clostridium sp. AM58-1XD]